MPRQRRGNLISASCPSCFRFVKECNVLPCEARFYEIQQLRSIQNNNSHYNKPSNNAFLQNYYSTTNYPPMQNPINQTIVYYGHQQQQQQQLYPTYNFENSYLQRSDLLLKLHERSEIVGRAHSAVMKTCTIKGMVIDLIIFDQSGRDILPWEKDDEILYPEIPLSFSPSEYIIPSLNNFPRYIFKNVTIQWENLSLSINTLPLNIRIQSTIQFVPPNSIFKVYCQAFDCTSFKLSLRMANKSSPKIKLQPYINTKLSFSKPKKQALIERQGERPRFLVIIDFEATCDYAPNPLITLDNSEIIEFPWIVLDTVSLDIVYERRIYVKPSFMEGITNYCVNLTGITKEICKSGLSLQDAVSEFDKFVRDFLFPYGENNFRIVTDSIWDLQVQLRLEAQRKNIKLGWWYKEYFDLRQEFRHFYAWFPFVKRGPPLHTMLQAFNLDFFGKHHSGLDDCKSIAQIVKILLQLHPHTFARPKIVPEDYSPHNDPSWCSFIGNCPPDAWLCSNEKCQVWNRPFILTCRFCKSQRSLPPSPTESPPPIALV